MLIHAWITDIIFDEQKIPPCGTSFVCTHISVIVAITSHTGFVLGTPRQVYRFLATSEEEKKSWFSTLHKLIFAQKHLFTKVSHCIQ